MSPIISTVVEFISKVAIVLVTVVILLWILLYFLFGPSKEEVARIPSPSGKVVATLVETNGGATTSFGYEVYLASSNSWFQGTKVAFLYGAVQKDSPSGDVHYGVNLRWNTDSELLIQYLDARWVNWDVPEWYGSDSKVQVTLRPRTEDPNAPIENPPFSLK